MLVCTIEISHIIPPTVADGLEERRLGMYLEQAAIGLPVLISRPVWRPVFSAIRGRKSHFLFERGYYCREENEDHE
jgi:hypothetical protein